MCGLCVFSILIAPFSVHFCPYRELWLFILLAGCGCTMLLETLAFLNKGLYSSEAAPSSERLSCVLFYALCVKSICLGKSKAKGRIHGMILEMKSMPAYARAVVSAGPSLQNWPWSKNQQHREWKNTPTTFPPRINFILKIFAKQYVTRNVDGPRWFLLVVPTAVGIILVFPELMLAFRR